MKISKETITRVEDGDGVIGEVAESGGKAEIRLRRQSNIEGKPLIVNGDAWAAFVADVKALDRHVPMKAAAAAAAALPGVPAAIKQRATISWPRAGHIVVQTQNGARITLGRLGARALRKLGERPEHWHRPAEVFHGGSGPLRNLYVTGLVERVGPAGRGRHQQYRIGPRGLEALNALKARETRGNG